MIDTKYNGWTNYATWRVNIELFDGINVDEFGEGDPEQWCDVHLAEALKERAEYWIECTSEDGGMARDFALAFIADVNWREIANHIIEACKG